MFFKKVYIFSNIQKNKYFETETLMAEIQIIKEDFEKLTISTNKSIKVSTYFTKEKALVIYAIRNLEPCYHCPRKWCLDIYPSTTYTGKKFYSVDVIPKYSCPSVVYFNNTMVEVLNKNRGRKKTFCVPKFGQRKKSILKAQTVLVCKKIHKLTCYYSPCCFVSMVGMIRK